MGKGRKTTHLGSSSLHLERIFQAQHTFSVYVYIRKPEANYSLCTQSSKWSWLSPGSEHFPLIELHPLLQIPTPERYFHCGISAMCFKVKESGHWIDKSVGWVYISPTHLVWSVLPVNLNTPGLNKSIELNNIGVNPKPRILKQAKK